MKENEFVKLIGNLSSNESLGLHSIPIKLLKNHADSFKQPLTYLINPSSH